MKALDIDAVNRLVEVVEEVDPEFLLRLRWLLLGDMAGSKLFPEGFCVRPTWTELQRLLARLKVRGHTYQSELLQRVSNTRPDGAMENLTFLESLPPNSWHHPAEVIKRPWELDRMLKLCQERLDATRDPQYQALLESIIPKLEKAKAIEDTAAERRLAESFKQTGRPKPRRKPKKVS